MGHSQVLPASQCISRAARHHPDRLGSRDPSGLKKRRSRLRQRLVIARRLYRR